MTARPVNFLQHLSRSFLPVGSFSGISCFPDSPSTPPDHLPMSPLPSPSPSLLPSASLTPPTLRKSSSNLYAPPPVAQMLSARLEKFFALASSMKAVISLVGKRMKWSVPTRPPSRCRRSSRCSSRTPVLPYAVCDVRYLRMTRTVSSSRSCSASVTSFGSK